MAPSPLHAVTQKLLQLGVLALRPFRRLACAESDVVRDRYRMTLGFRMH
jgi:hypothetical protein